MYDDDDEPEGPKSSFTIYHSEGNVHFNQGEYKKALDCYTQVKKDTPSLAYIIPLLSSHMLDFFCKSAVYLSLYPKVNTLPYYT